VSQNLQVYFCRTLKWTTVTDLVHEQTKISWKWRGADRKLNSNKQIAYVSQRLEGTDDDCIGSQRSTTDCTDWGEESKNCNSWRQELTVAHCAPFQIYVTRVPVPQQHEAEGLYFLRGGNQILTFCRWIAVGAGRTMAHSVSRRPLTGGGPGSIPGVYMRIVVEKVVLWQVSLLALLFPPVSTFPPMLHTHSFSYHPRYIMFLSQYFSFPLSVQFHQCSIPIHSPTTHAIQCYSPSTSVFPCQYHSTNAP